MLTSSLLTPDQLTALDNLVPKEHLEERDGSGNKKYAYVTKEYLAAQLNQIFGADSWSRMATEMKQENLAVAAIRKNNSEVAGHTVTYSCKVRLEVNIFGAGELHQIVRESYGAETLAAATDTATAMGDLISNAIKGAETDAFKRACGTLGYAFGLGIEKNTQSKLVLKTPGGQAASAAPALRPVPQTPAPAEPSQAAVHKPMPAQRPQLVAQQPAEQPRQQPATTVAVAAEQPKEPVAKPTILQTAAAHAAATMTAETPAASNGAIEIPEKYKVDMSQEDPFADYKVLNWNERLKSIMAEIPRLTTLNELLQYGVVLKQHHSSKFIGKAVADWHNLAVDRLIARCSQTGAPTDIKGADQIVDRVRKLVITASVATAASA